jgi:F-box and leucine-rich repeat protein GRR1
VIQQSSFCVFSGKGVLQLRAFLTELFDHMTEMNGTDDTEYDDDDFEPDDEIPEAEIEAEAEEEDHTVQDIGVHREDSSTIGGSQLRNFHPMQPQFHQYNRHFRASTVPPPNHRSIAINPYSTGYGVDHAVAGSSNSAPWRSRGQHNLASTLADNLPVIEYTNSASPSASDNASNRSGQTNNSDGVGFFRGGQDANISQPARSARNNGTLTPDLDFAEIGHGRGIRVPLQGSSNMPANAMVHRSYGAQIITANGHEHGEDMQVTGQQFDKTEMSQLWPHHETMQDSYEPDGSSEHCAGDGRGRSVKRALRNKLNAAEHYANSFFGRSVHDDNPRRGGGSRSDPQLL